MLVSESIYQHQEDEISIRMPMIILHYAHGSNRPTCKGAVGIYIAVCCLLGLQQKAIYDILFACSPYHTYSNTTECLLNFIMRLSLTVLTAAFLGFSSLNVDAVVIKYYCDGSGNHVAVPNICKNTCWGQNCMRLVSGTFKPSSCAHINV